MSKMKVHPTAALFPMLSPEELEELAADIKENGLKQPIVLDKNGQLIDGRNRLAACELAKIKPQYVELNGEDAEVFIISQNLARRHMNPGQRALVAAMVSPGGQGRTSATSRKFPMVAPRTLTVARAVMRVASDLAPNILSGAITLEHAYQEARNREQLASSDESKMKMLNEEARDLAERVTEDGMKINEAVAALQERKRERAETISRGKMAAEQGITNFLAAVNSIVEACKETDEKIIDRRRVSQVAKAVEQLQSLL